MDINLEKVLNYLENLKKQIRAGHAYLVEHFVGLNDMNAFLRDIEKIDKWIDVPVP